MRDSDGRKLDHKTLEQLRIRAVGQVEQGAHPDEVAAALGMTGQRCIPSWRNTARVAWRRSRPARSPGAHQD